MKVVLLILLALFKFSNSQLEENENLFKYKTILDNDNKVRLEWYLQEINQEMHIFFKLLVFSPEIPIIGFGMSDRGDFLNADMVLFEKKASKINDFNLYDCHTDNEGVLYEDKNANYFLIYSKITPNQEKAENIIEIIFERKLDTCDKSDYRIEFGTVHIVHFLFNSNKDFPNARHLFKKNTNFRIETDSQTNMKQVQFVKSTYFDESSNFDPNKSEYFDVTNNNVNLPAQHTTYWCLAYKLDKKFYKKHHIIAFEGLISKKSQGVVHHMELFHCITDPSEDMKSYNGECTSESKPKGLVQCRKVIAAWAMGASRFVYPDQVGGVIGGSDYSQYLVLEVHYDNPGLRSNIIDSSGLRIYYQGGSAKALRKYDAGIMEIGLEYNSKNSIPPKMDSFHLNGFCLSECTKVGLPYPNGITIFASQLHTHLTGRRVWTSLVRNNKVIKIINSDNHYDQMFQEIRLLRKPVQVKPGDALINTCVYETNSRVNMTFGGYSIRDEMCVNYMHYYPVAQLEVCKSSISDEILQNYFAKMKEYDLSNTSSLKTIEENFNSIRWTPLTSSILSKLYDISPISFSCNSSDGAHIPQVYANKDRNSFEIIKPEGLRTDYAPVDKDLSGKCEENSDDYFYD